jgi:glycyl-tRNA synthetase beta chain
MTEVTHDDLLFEIGTEELPPKALSKMLRSLEQSFAKTLQQAQLDFDSVKGFATPRRLAIVVRKLASAQLDQNVERRGPALAAAFNQDETPSKALLGFMRSCGIDDASQLEKQVTDKGTWLVFRQQKTGEKIEELLPKLLQQNLAALPIDRKMRWGTSREEFIRPVHWLVLLYGERILPANVFGISSGNITKGHRFMSSGDILLDTAVDYEEKLAGANVVVDFEKRKSLIREQLKQIAMDQSAKMVIEEDLLDEVTALVEWPVALIGSFSKDFLEVPEEALVSAMQSHQRYFHLVDDSGSLIPKFVTVANIESTKPQSVVNGNERVIAPRLADARFFFEQDKKSSLAAKLERLSQVVFQSSLGSYADKAKRIASVASSIASITGADAAISNRAGLLCKVDLVTNMVSEFPDLQGIMGGYYAENDNEPNGVAEAIRDHYLPTQSGGDLPKSLEGQCVAIADKLDTLTGLFGIGQPPTGSKDPYALRRQTLGIVRTCIENALPLRLSEIVGLANSAHGKDFSSEPVVSYMIDRMENWYHDEGIPSDCFNAIRMSNSSINDMAEAHMRLLALQEFRQQPECQSIVASNKRIANILKKFDSSEVGNVDRSLFIDDQEHALYDALSNLSQALNKTNAAKDKLLLLEQLQAPIDAYFEAVMVMADDDKTRRNRLITLAETRRLFLDVADFSLLQ